MSIEDKQESLIREFSFLENWEDRYEHLIALGQNLEPFDERLKTDNRMIKGCQSRVWIDADFHEGKLFFKADADGILPKGIAAILIRIFSGEPTIDIVNSYPTFIEKIGFQEFLSPSRANGMLAMIKQIKFLAIVYQSKHIH